MRRAATSPGSSGHGRSRSTPAIASLLFLLLLSCDDSEAPAADPAIDRQARSFLRAIESHDIDAIRRPLNEEGKESITSRSLERIFGYFESGAPEETTLIGAEKATSDEPTPAERHRLIYTIRFADDRRYHYFFEATISGADTLVTGFQVEPRE